MLDRRGDDYRYDRRDRERERDRHDLDRERDRRDLERERDPRDLYRGDRGDRGGMRGPDRSTRDRNLNQNGSYDRTRQVERRSPERDRWRHSDPDKGASSRGHRREQPRDRLYDDGPRCGSRIRSPERRSASLASQYDSLFDGMDWYRGATGAATSSAGTRESSVTAPTNASPAITAAEVPTLEVVADAAPAQQSAADVAEQKQRLLKEFLNRLGHSDPQPLPSSDADREATVGPAKGRGGADRRAEGGRGEAGGTPRGAGSTDAPTTSAIRTAFDAPVAMSGCGSDKTPASGSCRGGDAREASNSPRAQLVRSFMTELEGTGADYNAQGYSSALGGSQDHVAPNVVLAADTVQRRDDGVGVHKDMDYWRRATEALEADLYA